MTVVFVINKHEINVGPQISGSFSAESVYVMTTNVHCMLHIFNLSAPGGSQRSVRSHDHTAGRHISAAAAAGDQIVCYCLWFDLTRSPPAHPPTHTLARAIPVGRPEML